MADIGVFNAHVVHHVGTLSFQMGAVLLSSQNNRPVIYRFVDWSDSVISGEVVLRIDQPGQCSQSHPELVQ